VQPTISTCWSLLFSQISLYHRLLCLSCSISTWKYTWNYRAIIWKHDVIHRTGSAQRIATQPEDRTTTLGNEQHNFVEIWPCGFGVLQTARQTQYFALLYGQSSMNRQTAIRSCGDDGSWCVTQSCFHHSFERTSPINILLRVKVVPNVFV